MVVLTRLSIALTLALGSVLFASAPPSHAEPSRTQLVYTCQLYVEENPTEEPYYEDFTFAIQIDAPTAVSPGEEVTLRGTFSVVIPEQIRGLLAAYFPSMQVVSDAFSLTALVDGRSTVLRTTRFDTGRVSTSQAPLVLDGPVTADTFTVPADAAGRLVVQLPGDGQVEAIIPGNKRTAIAAIAYFQGGLVPGYDQGTDRLDCRPKDARADRTIVSIPIRESESGRPDAAPTTPGGVPSATQGPSVAAPEQPTAPVTPGSAAPSSAPPGAPVTTDVASPAAAGAAPVASTLPPADRDGIHLDPRLLWPLIFAVALVLIVLNALSVHRARVRRVTVSSTRPTDPGPQEQP